MEHDRRRWTVTAREGQRYYLGTAVWRMPATGAAADVTTRNFILRLLDRADRALLEPDLEMVSLPQKFVLCRSYEPIEHVYFFESGLSSEIAPDHGGEKIEVGCIGKEGLSGLPVVLGVSASPHRSFMEVGGDAYRIPSPRLRELMQESASLRGLLLRYVHVFMIQIAATALADGRYQIEQRLARWLLMSHDRLEQDELPLTHEFLSLMLGVRRSSVTDALHVLEGERIIKASRGLITVRDRQRLEKVAGHCYGVPEREYERIMRASADAAL